MATVRKAKKKNVRASFKKSVVEDVREVSLVDTATDNLKIYGSYTLEQRAIPDYRDGLKPVHRMSMWGMKELPAHYTDRHQKAAKIVGLVIGNFHPHGDVGVYDAMVTMANLPERLIDGRGNWGSPTDEAGAYRYTECRLSQYAEETLLDKDYLAVMDYVDNFSGDRKIPVILPAKLPNLLINGSEGIGTGASGFIPSFTKDSVVLLVKRALKGKPITAKSCFNNLEFKFKYGGTYAGSPEDLLEYFTSGKGTLLFTPSFKMERDKIVITSFAPRFITGKSLEGRMEKYSKLANVERVQDESDKEGWKIAIYYKKRLDEKQLEELLNKVKQTSVTKISLQTSITERFKDESVKFRYSSIPEVFNDWIKWRIELEMKVIHYLISVKEKELEKLSLLQLAAQNLDTMKRTMDVAEPIKILKKLKLNGTALTDSQADFLLELRFKQLTKLSRSKLLESIKTVKLVIVSLTKDLKDPNSRILKSL
jgi:DNA gyrase/topoisomerase IV subunit A